jgi:Leucine-rich repeat (LRR) protein
LFNPFTTPEGLELFLYKLIKSLKCVNHKELTQLQLEEHDKPLTEITEEMIKENSKIMQTKGLQEHNWKLSIENLILTHCRLASMRGLETLVNLRQLNLSHNLIEVIDFIQNCKLMELNLEENRISRIERLS